MMVKHSVTSAVIIFLQQAVSEWSIIRVVLG